MSPHPSPPFKTMLRDYLNPRRLESRINFTNLQFNRWTRDGDQSQKVLRMTHYTKNPPQLFKCAFQLQITKQGKKKPKIIKLPGILPSKRHSSRIIMVQKCARVFVN